MAISDYEEPRYSDYDEPRFSDVEHKCHLFIPIGVVLVCLAFWGAAALWAVRFL